VATVGTKDLIICPQNLYRMPKASCYHCTFSDLSVGAKNVGVFRVKNHDFTPKKLCVFQLRREARKCLGCFVGKITILRQQIIFFPILGGGGGGAREQL
jgi:hypothetical protein